VILLVILLVFFSNNTPIIKATELMFDDEVEMYNWYEGDGLSNFILPKANASSYLKAYKDITYVAQNANEGSLESAWVEGKPDYGIGESIEFTYTNSTYKDHKFIINEVVIFNGYYKTQEIWLENSRVKNFKLYVNDKEAAILELIDIRDPQKIELPAIEVTYYDTTKIKFEILEVYKGSKYKDTAITSFKFNGKGCM
jgi:hypothetical protein